MAHDHKFFAELACSEPVTWTSNIKQMFTAIDIAHMKTKGLDLSSYEDVKINAVAIYSHVSSGSMPPPGSGEQPWSAQWVATFGCWIQQNCPE
jgi:tyrosinase